MMRPSLAGSPRHFWRPVWEASLQDDIARVYSGGNRTCVHIGQSREPLGKEVSEDGLAAASAASGKDAGPAPWYPTWCPRWCPPTAPPTAPATACRALDHSSGLTPPSPPTCGWQTRLRVVRGRAVPGSSPFPSHPHDVWARGDGRPEMTTSTRRIVSAQLICTAVSVRRGGAGREHSVINRTQKQSYVQTLIGF